MCESRVEDYKRCARPASARHSKSTIKYCTRAKLRLYGNTAYHPIRVTSSSFTKAGTPIHPVIDETCPICYPEKAAAEQEQRKEEAEKQAAIAKIEADEEQKKTEDMVADITPCMDEFAPHLS